MKISLKNFDLVRSLALCAFLFTAFSASILAETVSVSLKLKSKSVSVGMDGKGELQLTVIMPHGWHTYGIIPHADKDGIGPQATEITVGPKETVGIGGKIIASKPHTEYDKGFLIDVETYEGSAKFTIPIQAVQGLKKGEYKSFVVVRTQICDTVHCLPANDDTVHFSIVVNENISKGMVIIPPIETPKTEKKDSAVASPAIGQTDAGTKSNNSSTTESQGEIQNAKSKGVLSFLWFAMLAGLTALLTPCVFPMIPITVSFFTKRAEKTRGKGLRDSLVYSLGIILTFTALGFILSLIFGSSGISNFATNPFVNIGIATLFIVFALNLFGAFEIQIPTSIMNKLNRASSGSGIGSVLLMGLTFSLTSFTCTVPFVGSALVSASNGEWFYPIIGMLGFSSMFALPFFLLALFPSVLSTLPRSGGWMNNVKVVMGFMEIAAALKFISNSDLVFGWGILSREVFLAIWIACGFLVTMYVLGVFQLSHDSKVDGIGATRAMFALTFATISFYLLSGLYGKPLGELDAYLPPLNYHELINGAQQVTAVAATTSVKIKDAKDETKPAEWITSYEEGLKLAQSTGKPVFIDFTGFTCTNCRWMEANIFSQPEIKELMGKTIKVQLYTDRAQEPYKSNKQLQLTKFGSIELPLYAIISPTGEVIATKSFTRDRAEFIAFLRKAGV